MRFEAKKKALSSAAKLVRTITDALASSGQASDVLYIIATGKKIKLRTVAGGQVVERTLTDDVLVTEEGSAPIDPAAFSNALSVGGETFKVVRDGQYLNFACGKAKGRLEVKKDADDDAKDEALDEAPKATVSVPGFRTMLKAIALKAQGKAGDRTIHIDQKKKLLRGEATDEFRGVAVVVPAASDAKLPGSASLSLPSKALDTIGVVLEDAALIGFDEKFFSIRTPGLFISLPQASTPPIDIASQLADLLSSDAARKGLFEIKVKEIKEALSDALAIASDKANARLTVCLGSDGGQTLGEGDAGSIETDFDIEKADTEATLKIQVIPSFLRECLEFYNSHESINIAVYDSMIVLDLPNSTEFVASQTTVIPLLATVVAEAPKSKKPGPQTQKKAAPVEEDEEPAPPKKPTKKPAAPPPEEDEEEPAPVKKPAAKKQAEPEDDEEPAAKPKKKPVVEDDEEAPPAKAPVEDDEEEDFDDEE